MSKVLTGPWEEGPAPRSHDPRLQPFLDAPDDEPARTRLGELLEGELAPLVRAVVRAQLSGARSQTGEDLEDVCAGALLRLSERLWLLRREPGAAPLADVLAYAVTTAHNACHAFLRRRHPERARLRSRLRYLLARDPHLGLWPGPAREWVCGLAEARGQPASAAASQRLQELRGRVAVTAPGASTGAAAAFVTLVRGLLERAGAPCRLEQLVGLLEDVLGLADPGRTAARGEPGEDRPEPELAAPDPRPGIQQQLEQRGFLESLWAEVQLLPPHQRAALLLNLRDAQGRGMIGLLPLTGLASVERIGALLGFEAERFARLWPELPCDDEWIARELRVTRRQVINFRKCARERLARRLRDRR